MEKVRKLISFLLEILYPRKCPVCGRVVTPRGALICPSCRGRVSFVKEPRCKKCGRELLFQDREYCGDCSRHERHFAYGVVLMNYDNTARKILADLKYHNKRDNADYIAAEMAARLGNDIRRMRPDALIPVPVHPRRKRIRGFNQAELLAVRLGQRLGIPVRTDLLIRIKNTRPQKELGSLERLNNLLKAFTVRKSWDPALKTVVLVDDIYTTGSTAEACTRALLSAGAGKVCLINAASGRDK